MAFDEEEFTEIFTEVYPNLCRFLESFLGNHQAAQDIAQESLMRLFRQNKETIPRSEARFWLFRVARNLALNEIRNAKKRDGFFGRIREVFYRSPAAHDRVFEQAETLKFILDALQILPERQRAALLLREQEALSYRELSEVLSVSENQVKTDIFRARRTLRKKTTG